MKFFETYKKQIFLLLIIFLAALAFFTTGSRGGSGPLGSAAGFIVTPLEHLSSSITSAVGQAISSLTHEQDLAEENEELRAQVALLEEENHRLSLYEEENERLSSLLDLAQKYPAYETTGAYVIAKDPGNWFDVFLIDAGWNKDVMTDMVVMAPEGVIGRITESGPIHSQVLSILDSRSSVSAMSLRTGDLGVVRGDYTLMNDGLCRMEYIDADSEIMTGDEIVTSGLSDIFPAGLTLGYVQEVVTDSNGLTKYAIIAPAVDFKHISSVLVLSDQRLRQEGQTESTLPPSSEDADASSAPQEQGGDDA
ncbi:MAG TPA: rod shape-determining protein MreC [Firmicutes bacterium]|nr:rod shape-determining protein MreC [Bacillota bacterium]